MHIIQELDELITLANKAKVLLGISSDSEPIVTLKKNSDKTMSVTFKSTCFPFFPENGFYTFSIDKLSSILDKCKLFVSNLEKNSDMSIEATKLLFEKVKATKSKKSDCKTPSVTICSNGKLTRYKVLLCDYHKKNPNRRLVVGKNNPDAKIKCNCRIVKEEASL